MVATRPDTIILMGGRNDWSNGTRNTRKGKGEVEAAATKYIAALQVKLRYTRIAVVGPPWGTQSRGTRNVTANRVYYEVRNAARKQRVEFIETYTGLLNPSSSGNFMADGIHPTAKGQQAIANRVIAGI